MEIWIESLLAALALPKFGLSTVFIVSLISATLLPLGSEPAVFGLVKLDPTLFWPAVGVATVGNTLGGAISWWMGFGAEKAWEQVANRPATEHRALQMLRDGRARVCIATDVAARGFGPKACLLSWLPGVGDPLCAVAGWLRLPFWPCVVYMAIGKFGRYLVMTAALLWVFPGQFTP